MYSERLKELRNTNNLSQSKLADMLNIARGTYSHYELEDDIFSVRLLLKISLIFNVSFDYIFGFTTLYNYNDYQDFSIDKLCIRLREIRKENKLTQIQFAKILKIGVGTLSEYEHGKYIIATTVLYDICKKYKISADYLLGKVDEPKYLN